MFHVDDMLTKKNCLVRSKPQSFRLLRKRENKQKDSETEVSESFIWLREPDLNRRSGLALSICAARCLRKRKCLPSFFGRLTPPPAALPRSPPGYENWVRRLKRRGQRSQGRCASSPSPTNHLKTSLVAIPILGHTSGKIAIQRENCRETPTVQPPRQGITPTPSQPLIPQFPRNCAEIKKPHLHSYRQQHFLFGKSKRRSPICRLDARNHAA